MENKKITCLSEIENQLYSKEIKMTGENHADYGFNAYVSQEVLGGISKAFLDLHNSIVENQMIHSKCVREVGITLTKIKIDRLKDKLNTFIDLQFKMYCELYDKMDQLREVEEIEKSKINRSCAKQIQNKT